MSRIHLTLVVLIFWTSKYEAQSNLGTYLKYAEEKYKAGDFYYSAELYEKAMNLDSNSISILWNYAETLRAYKDYPKAAYYYAKVYSREEGTLYPMALLYLGLMQKQNGKFNEALETFKKVNSKYSKDKKSYQYLKSKQEIQSCQWAMTEKSDSLNVVFTHLPETINSKDTEFGHTFHDNKLYFSSLRADSINADEEVYTRYYISRLYNAKKPSPHFEQAKVSKEFIFKDLNVGNGTFSKDGSRFYFSLCKNEAFQYHCKIMVATYAGGRLSRIDSLGPIINVPGFNTTMPSVSELNGEEVLFFSSDRKEGEGGMDLWYATIKNGSQFGKPINLKSLNSPDNELSPWFDTINKKLYFSSSWHNGFGGYDIFESEFNGQFLNPKNVGQPLNSSANDLYYFLHGDTAYLSSNRLGVHFSKNPTCCSDIFSAYPSPPPTPPIPSDSLLAPIIDEETDMRPDMEYNIPDKENLFELTKRLPVTLYFHNDCPDPRSRDTSTNINYINGYLDYRAMLPKYQSEYSNGMDSINANSAKEDIKNFFIKYVDQGAKDLDLFTKLLIEALKKGSKINLTVKGFASPLAKTDYNVYLTKRRIASLINYFRAYENGLFIPYLDGTDKNGGKLQFTQIPFGEYTADKLTSDNPNDQKHAVYSQAAAIERKIEIEKVESLNDDPLPFILEVMPPVLDLALLDSKKPFERKLQLRNNSSDTLRIASIEIDHDVLALTIPKILPPESEVEIIFTPNKPLPLGLFSLQARIYFMNHKHPLLMTINGEGY